MKHTFVLEYSYPVGHLAIHCLSCYILRYSPTDSHPGFCVFCASLSATWPQSFHLSLVILPLFFPNPQPVLFYFAWLVWFFFSLACSWTDRFGLPLSGFDLCTNQSCESCIFGFVKFVRNLLHLYTSPAACFQRPHLHNCDIMLITWMSTKPGQRSTDHHLPISSQKAQTGGADLVAEHVDLQAHAQFVRTLFYRAGLCLIDHPPFLGLIQDIFSPLQLQAYVKHLFIWKGEERKNETDYVNRALAILNIHQTGT